MAEEKKEKVKNPQVIIDDYIQKCMAKLKLLDFKEIVLVFFDLNRKLDLFTDHDLLKAFINSIDNGNPEITSILSLWIERYKEFLLNDHKMDASNIEEGIKFYEQDLNSTINSVKKGKNRY